ncbi:MAG TPA: peptidylprolyl isomerase [Allosphingosinicella sp.]|jgi:peptidyl-prolyl cis-trans isomerase A (cyclophilin A)
MIRPFLCLASLALAGCGDSAPPANQAAADPAPLRSFDPPVPRNLPDIVRVRIDTEAGTIIVALDHRHAPVTTTNFIRYADDHRFDGTFFYRAARSRGTPGEGFIQGGIAHSARLLLPPIRLEPTSETGLRHGDGTISMAHSTPDTAMGDFVICIGAQPGLDARGKDKGYAAFGRVAEGMDVVRRLFASPAARHPGSDRIAPPVRILRVARAE